MKTPHTTVHASPLKKKASPIVLARQVPLPTRVMLFAKAGGRCEFDGCNRYLLEHHLTHREGIFAQMAHVVAFKPEGPRGRDGKRPANIHALSNLMLLCQPCHTEVDRHPDLYGRRVLEEYKARHELRIRHVTSLGPNRSTSVIIFKAPIRGELVGIPFDQVVEAVAPRYPSLKGTTIDLNTLQGQVEGAAFLKVARDKIDLEVNRLLAPGSDVERTQHISLFALAPIPLLMFLGTRLSNKVPLDVYQHHRAPESWSWKTTGSREHYRFRRLKGRPKKARTVALIVSLSGKIRVGDLPPNVRHRATVYEITLARGTPRTTFLRQRGDLERFRLIYQEALGSIVQDHGLLPIIDIFPAVPAPIAVLLGRECLPKVHPGLRIYDYDKAKGGFTHQFEVNTHG